MLPPVNLLKGLIVTARKFQPFILLIIIYYFLARLAVSDYGILELRQICRILLLLQILKKILQIIIQTLQFKKKHYTVETSTLLSARRGRQFRSIWWSRATRSETARSCLSKRSSSR